MPSLTYIRASVIFAGSADWSSEKQAFGLLLATSEYKPSRTHRFVSEVLGELAGGGYVRQELKGRALLANDAVGCADCVADAVTFSKLRSTESYRWVVVFRKGKADADSELICAVDMAGEDGAPGISLRANTDHTIRWDGQPKNGRVFSIQSGG